MKQFDYDLVEFRKHSCQTNYFTSKQDRMTTAPSMFPLHTTIIQNYRMQERTTSNGREQEWLEELDRQITANISKMNFTIDDLAEYMSISKRQLYRLINERLGETPHTYLKNYRLNYAKTLIETGQVDTVKAAAYSTGFPNTVYFSRQFKAAFGYLPSELL